MLKDKIKNIVKKMLAVFAAFSLNFLGVNPTVEASYSNDTLVIGVTDEPYSLSPFNAPERVSRWVQGFFYESLLDHLGPTEFRPRLGEFEQKDETTIEIKINEDANWTDGTPVTAKDVAFTINTIAHPDVASSESRNIAMIEGTNANGKSEEAVDELEGVTILDDKTLEIKTKYPVDLNYVSELLGVNLKIAPAHVFEEYPKDQLLSSDPVQAPTVTQGAYRFVEKLEGQYVHLEANEDYYRGAPKIKNIYIKKIDPTSVVTEVESGNIHMTAGQDCAIRPDDVVSLEETGKFNIRSHANNSTNYLFLNNANPRFSDKRVRQGLTMAIDRQAILDNLFHGKGTVNATPYNPESAYYNEDVQALPYDPEKAKELLEEAGFDFGEPIKIIVSDTAHSDTLSLIQQYLLQVGVEVVQEMVDLPTLVDRFRKQDYDGGIVGNAVRYDPDLTALYGSQSSNNFMHFKSDEVDELLEEGLAKTIHEERLPVYHKLQEVLRDEVPTIPIACLDFFTIQVPELKGGAADFYPATFSNVHEWTFE